MPDGFSKEELADTQWQLADQDPDILGADLNHPLAAVTLTMARLLMLGKQVVIVRPESSGELEVTRIEPIGPGCAGKVGCKIRYGSTDNLLSNDTAGLIAGIFGEDVEAAANKVLGQ